MITLIKLRLHGLDLYGKICVIFLKSVKSETKKLTQI